MRDRSASWSHPVIVLAVFVALLVVTGWLYTVVPTGFSRTRSRLFHQYYSSTRGGFAELHQRYHASGGNRTAEAAGNAATFAIGGFDFNGGFIGEGVILLA